MLWPGSVWVCLLSLVSIVGLGYVFLGGNEASPIAYVVYVISAYALTILVAGINPMVQKVKVFIFNNEHAKRYFTDIPYRVYTEMILALIVNLLFAALKLVSGILYTSLWSIAVGGYYIILCIVRVHLIRFLRKPDMDMRSQHREYRRCGWMLIVMHLALTGVVFQMVHRGEGNAYPELLVFAVAAYAFYSITISIINIIRYRKYNSPLLMASKAVGLAAALVAILTLQTAMFSSFGAGTEEIQPIMNAATGAGVLVFILGMAVYMVIKSNRELKNLKR